MSGRHSRAIAISFLTVSLDVAAGEILAVMGPSGSGTSTLPHCLAGILVPDSGQIHFDRRRQFGLLCLTGAQPGYPLQAPDLAY